MGSVPARPPAAQPLSINRLVTVAPGYAQRYATVAVKLGDRITLRAAAGPTEGFNVGFVVPNQIVTRPPTPPYRDDWTDCQLRNDYGAQGVVDAGQADEISRPAARADTLLLQALPSE